MDKKGNLWIGTTDGLSCYNGTTFRSFTTDDGVVNNSINCITEDKSGDLWISARQALNRYDGNAFSSLTSLPAHVNNPILCITEDKSGNIWSAPWSMGLSCFDGKRFITYTSAQGLVDQAVMCIFMDSPGNPVEANTFDKSLTDAEHKALMKRFSRIEFDSITPWDHLPVNLKLPYVNNNIGFVFNAIETD